MGEMADWVLETIVLPGDDDGTEDPWIPCGKVCRYCGAENLHWEKTKAGSWRLFESDNQIHTCSSYKSKGG